MSFRQSESYRELLKAFSYIILILIILQFNSLPYDYLVIFLFLTDFYFTRRLPRSTLRLLKNKGALTVAQYYIGKHICNVWSSDNTYDSNPVGAVLHLCVYYMYLWRTPSIRCSPHKLKLNLIKVAMFVLSDHLFRHSFNCVCYIWYHMCWSTVPGDMMRRKYGVHHGIMGLWIEDPDFLSLFDLCFITFNAR